MNSKITWAELALTTPNNIAQGVNVYTSNCGGTPIKQIVMSAITDITFTSDCMVLPLQAMGSLEYDGTTSQMMMGEIHNIKGGTVYRPNMAFSTLIIIGGGDVTG